MTLVRRHEAAVLGALVSALAFVVLVASGASPGSSVLITLVVAVQAIGGGIAWKALNPQAGAVALIGMGLGIGTAAAVLSGVAVLLLGLGSWGWALPTLAVLACWLVARWRGWPWGTRGSGDRPTGLDRPVVAALGVASVLGLAMLAYNLRSYPLSWEGSWSGYHTDMPFFEALATSMARLGPLDSIFLPGGQVRYHWLVYGWAGQVTSSGGAEPFVVLTRIVPLVSIVAGSFIVISWARRFSRVAWVPSVAAALFLIGGYLGAVYGGVLTADSPSQSMSVVWLLAFTVAYLHLMVRRAGTPWLLALLGVLGFAMTGGKISSAAPALLGVLVVAVFALVRRDSWRWRALGAAGMTWAAVVLAFLLLLSGSSGGGGLMLGSLMDRASSQQGLNPLDGPLGVVAGTAILLVAIGARWAGLVWLGVAPATRWQPATLFGLGLAVASLGAVVAFNSTNEIWFAAAAAAPLSVLTAIGAGDAADFLGNDVRRQAMRIAVVGAVWAVLVFAAVWVLWVTGASGGNVWVSTWRWAGPVAGVALAVLGGWVLARMSGRGSLIGRVVAGTCVILVFATVPGRLLGVGTDQVGVLQNGLRNEWFSRGAASVMGRDVDIVTDWTDTQMAAARWLRDTAAPTDVLATNRTFGPFVPAVTGLATHASGILYQAAYGRPAIEEALLRNEGESWDFIVTPSEATVSPLCAAGVRWLWVDPRLTPVTSWLPYAEVAFQVEDVTILRLLPASCPE